MIPDKTVSTMQVTGSSVTIPTSLTLANRKSVLNSYKFIEKITIINVKNK